MDAEPSKMEFTVAGSKEHGFIDDLVPAVAEELSSTALVSKEAVEAEIDMMLRTIRSFWNMEPDQVMRMTSALSARATEMSVHLHRLETKREWRQVRTLQVNQVIAELDRQFRLASRLLEVRRQDLEVLRG